MSIYDENDMDRKDNGRPDATNAPPDGKDNIEVTSSVDIDTTEEVRQDNDVDASIVDGDLVEKSKLEKALVRTIDWRLCTIAGILCSLNLLDSGIISSASVTTIFEDLGLGVGHRYSDSILVYTVASVFFQLPATIMVRMAGPRIWFSFITVSFGIITMVSKYFS